MATIEKVGDNVFNIEGENQPFQAVHVQDVDGDGIKDTAYIPFKYANFLGIPISNYIQVSPLGKYWAYVQLSKDGSLHKMLVKHMSHPGNGHSRITTTSVIEQK